jgi:hypothetical protein
MDDCACCEFSASRVHRAVVECCNYDYICCDCHDPKARERREQYADVRDGTQHAAIGQD